MARSRSRERLAGESESAYELRLAWIRQTEADSKRSQREKRPDESDVDFEARLAGLRAVEADKKRRQRGYPNSVDASVGRRDKRSEGHSAVPPTFFAFGACAATNERSEGQGVSLRPLEFGSAAKLDSFVNVPPTLVPPTGWRDIARADVLPPYEVGGVERTSAPVPPTLVPPTAVLPTEQEIRDGQQQTIQTLSASLIRLQAEVARLAAQVASLTGGHENPSSPEPARQPHSAPEITSESPSEVAAPAVFATDEEEATDVACVWKVLVAKVLLKSNAVLVPRLRTIEVHALSQVWDQAHQCALGDRARAEDLFRYWVEKFLADTRVPSYEKTPQGLYVRLHQLPTRLPEHVSPQWPPLPPDADPYLPMWSFDAARQEWLVLSRRALAMTGQLSAGG